MNTDGDSLLTWALISVMEVEPELSEQAFLYLSIVFLMLLHVQIFKLKVSKGSADFDFLFKYKNEKGVDRHCPDCTVY